MKIILVTICVSWTIFAGSITGKVVSVSDGDTITILAISKKTHKIRFEHIDTPEKSQAYGQAAKKHLSSIVFGKTVEAKVKTTDRYGRSIATIFLEDKNINLEMVKAGYAWHYKKYSKDIIFAAEEVISRKAKKGLWQDSNPVPPWEFRRTGRKSKETNTSDDPNLKFWVTTSSGIRHNSSCKNYKTTKGKATDENGGKRACKICGG